MLVPWLPFLEADSLYVLMQKRCTRQQCAIVASASMSERRRNAMPESDAKRLDRKPALERPSPPSPAGRRRAFLAALWRAGRPAWKQHFKRQPRISRCPLAPNKQNAPLLARLKKSEGHKRKAGQNRSESHKSRLPCAPKGLLCATF